MSLAPCSLPGSLPSFILGSDEMELGLGKSLPLFLILSFTILFKCIVYILIFTFFMVCSEVKVMIIIVIIFFIIHCLDCHHHHYHHPSQKCFSSLLAGKKGCQ